MPTKLPRVNISLPPDLEDLIRKDARSFHIGAATRVTQILYLHYERMAHEMRRNSKVLRGSGLLAERSELSMDFSGGNDLEPVQADEPLEGTT